MTTDEMINDLRQALARVGATSETEWDFLIRLVKAQSDMLSDAEGEIRSKREDVKNAIASLESIDDDLRRCRRLMSEAL